MAHERYFWPVRWTWFTYWPIIINHTHWTYQAQIHPRAYRFLQRFRKTWSGARRMVWTARNCLSPTTGNRPPNHRLQSRWFSSRDFSLDIRETAHMVGWLPLGRRWRYVVSHPYPWCLRWTTLVVLEWISIYWFSRAGPTASIRLYYEVFSMLLKGALVKIPVSTIPMGLSYFPEELYYANPA